MYYIVDSGLSQRNNWPVLQSIGSDASSFPAEAVENAYIRLLFS
jgi:hypothetical protein